MYILILRATQERRREKAQRGGLIGLGSNPLDTKAQQLPDLTQDWAWSETPNRFIHFYSSSFFPMKYTFLL